MTPDEIRPEDKPLNAAPEPKTEERSPAEIRAAIDATREELGDTVEALAEKTDVKAQAKAKVEDAKAQAQEKADEAKARAQELAGKAEAKAKQDPKPFAIAAGVLVLFLLWRRRRS
jgi:MYXO-CTERM domain-containing protein